MKRRKSIDQNANRRRNQSNKVTLEKRHSFIVWFRKRTRIPGPPNGRLCFQLLFVCKGNKEMKDWKRVESCLL